MALIGPDWTKLRAPGLDEFEAMARRAFEALPDPFRSLASEVTYIVADFADDDVLDELGAESPFEIMGLFTGIGMAHDTAVPVTGQMPNVIHLYRRPILDYWAESEDTLGEIITHVLVHEIGHHFGFSDDDLDAIDAGAADRD